MFFKQREKVPSSLTFNSRGKIYQRCVEGFLTHFVTMIVISSNKDFLQCLSHVKEKSA